MVRSAVVLVILLVCGSLHAEATWAQTVGTSTAPTIATSDPVGLQPVDWALIILYAVATIALGFYYSRRQESISEYFVGSGDMNPLLVGVSLFATLLSTISYLSTPGEASGKGPVVLLGLLAFPLVYLVVARWLIPVYMRQRVTSAYELLESRLGLSVRLLGASMFLALRLVWMTLLIYLASKAITVMMGVDPRWIPVVVLVTGAVSIVYTSLGGMRAVVITDLLQTVLLFGGAVLVLATVTYQFGGLGWFPTHWQESWDSQPIVSLDPKTRVTVLGTLLNILAWNVATMGGDQTSVQRFMATRDAGTAKQVVATQLIVNGLVHVTLVLVGFALLSYFAVNRELLPVGLDLKDNADDLFPRYISYHLPVGISGLVVAGMFAAAMSSVDSGVNSITAVVMTDFMDRLGMKPKSEKGHVRAAMALALGIGVIVVLGSSSMKYIEGNITAVTNKTVNLLTTPIFALFFFAVFVRNARPLGVWIGAICGVATGAAIAFSGPLVYLLYSRFGIDPGTFNVSLITSTDPATGVQWTTAEDPISFQWIGPVALFVNVTIGWLACQALAWFDPRPDVPRTTNSP